MRAGWWGLDTAGGCKYKVKKSQGNGLFLAVTALVAVDFCSSCDASVARLYVGRGGEEKLVYCRILVYLLLLFSPLTSNLKGKIQEK